MIDRQSTVVFDTEEADQSVVLKQPLPLVLEILPGQAGEGLIDVHEPGTYEDEQLLRLIFKTLERKDWSIEEQHVLDDINRQLSGGKMLWRGQEIEGKAMAYAVLERTEAGEEYFYVPVRVIKPQEGGAHRCGRDFGAAWNAGAF